MGAIGWVKRAAILGVCAFAAACASAPPPPPAPPPFPMTRSSGAWAFDYDSLSRTASASLRSPQGALLVEISCQAPRGPVEVRDWTLNPAPGPVSLQVQLGASELTAAGTAPALSVGSGGVRFAFSPLDMAVMNLFEGQTVAVRGPSNGHDWGPDAAEHLISVANACASRGS